MGQPGLPVNRKILKSVLICVWFASVIILSAAGPQAAAETIPCPVSHFLCGNMSQCVHQKFWCDGVKHCKNGIDEIYETCQDNGAWWQQVTSFNYSVNKTLTRTCTVDYPPVCDCVRNTSIDCRNRSLTSVPSGISPNATRLLFLGNRFEVLPNGTFKTLKRLRVLSLESCHVRKISVDAFQGLVNLEKIVLEDNQLEKIGSGVFRHTPKLNWMFMVSNKLKYLPKDLLKGLHHFTWLELRYNQLTLTEDFPPSESLNWLDLDYNHIEILRNTTFARTPALTLLMLDSNRIHTIDEDAFRYLPDLLELNLSNNKMTTLPPEIFRYNTKLETLRLKNNPIAALPTHVFQFNIRLVSLNLTNTAIQEIQPETFEHLTSLEHVYMKYYDHCALVPHVRDCHPKTDGISDLHNLLANRGLRVVVWLVAMFTLIGNAVVLLGRIIDMFREKDKSFHLVSVANLSAADFLMGLYLLIIGSFDISFRGAFTSYYQEWTQSAGCHVSGFIGMVSSEVSILILAYMSIERYLIIAFPYRTEKITLKTTIICMVCIWCTGLVLAALPIIIWTGNKRKFYGTNSVCFPLHVHQPYNVGWEYSAFVFIGINSVALVTIIYCYTGLFLNIRMTQKPIKKMNKDIAETADNTAIAKRFFLFVVTDSACWIPIILVKVCALCLVSIPNDLHAWVAIVLLPINSAINPIIYSLTTVTFRRNLSRIFCTKRFQRFARKFSVGRRSTSSSLNFTFSVTRESNNPEAHPMNGNGHIGVRRTPSSEVTYLTNVSEMREVAISPEISTTNTTEDLSLITPLQEEEV